MRACYRIARNFPTDATMPIQLHAIRHRFYRLSATIQLSPIGPSRRAILAALVSAIGVVPFTAQAETAPPAPQAAPPPAPQTVVVFGDSQAEGLAAGLRRAEHLVPGLKVQNRTKAGTAISQPQNYDWPAAIKEYVPDPAVTTAVLMFGGNDRLPMHPATGKAIPFRDPAWIETYRDRIKSILGSLADRHLRVIWVSQPICRDSRYSQDMEFLNTIYRDEAASAGATYLDIWSAITDGSGQYAAYGHGLDGATTRLRLDDGIHFTPSGYDILASRVIQAISVKPDASK
jgi:hypothetical protein